MTNLPNNSAQITDKHIHRLVMAEWGAQKGGKTHFPLTAPAPVYVFNFDKPLQEDVAWKFKKEIHFKSYAVQSQSLLEFVDILTTKVGKLDTSQQRRKQELEQAEKDIYQDVLREFEQDFVKVLNHPDIKTVVVDTYTNLWTYAQIAVFGKVSQNNQYYYSVLNGMFYRYLKLAYGMDGLTKGTTKNVIFAARETAVWANDSQGQGYDTGEKKPDGWKHMPYEVQVNVRLWRETTKEGTDLPFHCTVENSSHNPDIVGRDLVSNKNSEFDMCDFPHLAQLVFPETSLEDWQ